MDSDWLPGRRILAPCIPTVLWIAVRAGLCVALGGCAAPVQPAASHGTVFYPPLPQRPRIQFLRTLVSADDIQKTPRGGLREFVIGDERPKQPRTLQRPYGVAWRDGRLYVCDSGARRGVIFDFERKRFGSFNGEGPDAFGTPINVALDPEGRKYVTDPPRGRIAVFDRQGRLIRFITHADGMKPCDAVWHEGQLYVADLKSSSVLVLDPADGRPIRRIGGRGSGMGQFLWPTNLTFGPGGCLFVVDTLEARVQKFDPRGKLMQVIGSLGRRIGKMVRPKGIAVDRAGRLYVADAATDSVQIYDPDGRLLLMLGGPGNKPGDMSLPAKVALSYEGIEHFTEHASSDFRIEYLIFVTSQLGPNWLNVYGFGTYEGKVPIRRRPTSRPAALHKARSAN